jgi:hypothetical protein
VARPNVATFGVGGSSGAGRSAANANSNGNTRPPDSDEMFGDDDSLLFDDQFQAELERVERDALASQQSQTQARGSSQTQSQAQFHTSSRHPQTPARTPASAMRRHDAAPSFTHLPGSQEAPISIDSVISIEDESDKENYTMSQTRVRAQPQILTQAEGSTSSGAGVKRRLDKHTPKTPQKPTRRGRREEQMEVIEISD